MDSDDSGQIRLIEISGATNFGMDDTHGGRLLRITLSQDEA